MKTLPSDPLLRGYLIAALFATDPCAPGGVEYSESGRVEELLPRVPKTFLDEAERDCETFKARNERDLFEAVTEHGRSWEACGGDLWFSRVGHGLGFWGRDLGDLGDRLHESASALGEHYLELGGWWIQEYRCECGEKWTRPEDADNDPEYGSDTCDCGKVVLSLNREQGEHLTDCDEPLIEE